MQIKSVNVWKIRAANNDERNSFTQPVPDLKYNEEAVKNCKKFWNCEPQVS